MKKAKNTQMDSFDIVLSEAIKDPKKRYAFYQAFLDLEVVAIGTVSSNNENEPPTLHLTHIDVEDELVLPIYSTWDKFYSLFKTEYKYVKIKVRDLIQLVDLQTPWILNPGFDLSKRIIPEELETLRDGRILHYYFEEFSLEEKKQFLHNQTVEIPEAVLTEISMKLRNFPSVEKAYLTYIYNPASTDQSVPLLGIEVDEQITVDDYLTKVFDAVNQVSQQLLEVVILTEDLPLTNSVKNNIKPFYVRTSVEDLKSMFR